jgi:hypothetical protein
MPGPHKHTNRLATETSPYLLQHAHNPVDWHPWNDDTLAKARSTDKMLLVSIGYSACHWCHVMERETFEDEEVAEVMNRHFICIKVDREERPDIDQIYMNAVQLISGSGGWPLNCFALPDGRPFFGGTYFRKKQWVQLLENIAQLFTIRREELEGQAESLAQGVMESNLVIPVKKSWTFSKTDIEEFYSGLEKRFDRQEGGTTGAPKFPMPVHYQFLLGYYNLTGNRTAADHIRLSMQKMAYGGIYDQIRGGFARYATDDEWRVPHFEKMLYDNAQLISVYARAYKVFKDRLYKEVAEESLTFIQADLTSPEGGFYSALDADSEGQEGKYYTWDEAEIKKVLGNQGEMMKKYYSIGGKGLWEGNRNILIRDRSPEEFARQQTISAASLRAILRSSKAKLLKARQKRPAPGLDYKILTSWNALMIKACVDAYKAFGKKGYLQMALRNAEFLLTRMTDGRGNLGHSYKPGSETFHGFLEDYSGLADAFISLHEVTLDGTWLDHALRLAERAIEVFYDPRRGLFSFASSGDKTLFTRIAEVHDNVMPSSNAVMAWVLFRLGMLFGRKDLSGISAKMLTGILPQAKKYPQAFAHWAMLLQDHVMPFYVVAIAGPEAIEKARKIHAHPIPNTIVTGSEGPSEMPYLKDRFVEGMTLIYICRGDSCLLPTSDPEEAVRLMK